MEGITLQVQGIIKRFPGVVALNGVSATFLPGECHALMGENGAGKSTLGKLLSGLYKPDEGTILLNEKEIHFASPLDAQKLGIGIVHQELLFCENLTVAENLALSKLPKKGVFVDNQASRTQAKKWLLAIGSKVNPDSPVSGLPIAQQQMVQIAGAIGAGAKVLIFDEPTSSLGPEETAKLLDLIRDLKSRGVTCIYVSHRLDEVFEICEKSTVLRDGKLVGTVDLSTTTKDQLVSMMIGRELEKDLEKTGQFQGEMKPLLEVRNLNCPGKFQDISFTLAEGEILGIGGLVGAGRTEVLEAIFGLNPLATGEIFLRGKKVDWGSPQLSLKNKFGLAPEDRKRHGLVLLLSCKQNITLPFLDKLERLGFIRSLLERAVSEKYFNRMHVKAPSIDTPSAALSGGNQQKLVLAKWLGSECDVLLVDEPTRGVDVGAKAEIHQLLRELAADKRGVIAVSSELPELISLSHRILIMRDGKIAGEITGELASEQNLMRLMAGLPAA